MFAIVFLSYLVWSELRWPLFTLGLLFLSVASANPLGQPCSLWPLDLNEFPLHILKRVHCHCAQVAASPGADGGCNVQSLLGRLNLPLAGV